MSGTNATNTAEQGPPAILLAGPTGIGKTALAVELAQRFRIEIISADSMQVYRDMPIGTAQPSEEERRRARFHLCGVIEPGEIFHVQRFLEMCDAARRDVISRGAVPLFVGGTGMYLRALRWGLFEQPSRDDALRAELEAQGEREGWPALHARLARLDPAAAARIHPGDRIRIVRALEIQRVTGRPVAESQTQWARPTPRFPHVMIVLVAGRETLARRIEARTAAMLEAGWVEETAALLARGVDPRGQCFMALGYREIIAHLNGEIDRAMLEQQIILRTRQFAKRQMTWLRRERPAIWLSRDADAPVPPGEFIEKLLAKQGIPFV